MYTTRKLILIILISIVIFAQVFAAFQNIPFGEFGDTGSVPKGESWGVIISSNFSNLTPVLFNSSSPTCGDWDLGSPNEAFGGPGKVTVGNKSPAGNISSEYANDRALGMIIITQESHSRCVPDDNAEGGDILFEFSNTTFVTSVGMLDIEEVRGPSFIQTLDENGEILSTTSFVAAGDNTLQTITIQDDNVKILRVRCEGSCGIGEVQIVTGPFFSPSHTLIPTLSLSPTATHAHTASSTCTVSTSSPRSSGSATPISYNYDNTPSESIESSSTSSEIGVAASVGIGIGSGLGISAIFLFAATMAAMAYRKSSSSDLQVETTEMDTDNSTVNRNPGYEEQNINTNQMYDNFT